MAAAVFDLDQGRFVTRNFFSKPNLGVRETAPAA
jgi:hypothetical protein